MSNEVITGETRRGKHPPWQPGQSGNPNGRPKGSKHRIGEAFLKGMQEDFEEHGIEVIAKVRKTRPADYLKIIAALLPQELNVTHFQKGSISDDELANIIDSIRSLALAGRGRARQAAISSGRTIEGTAVTKRDEET